MTTFTYQYWDEKGAVRSGTLRAADRTEALRQIQTAGRSVISLTEGGAVKPGWFLPHLPSWGKPALCLAVTALFLLCLAVLWWPGRNCNPKSGTGTQRADTEAVARTPAAAAAPLSPAAPDIAAAPHVRQPPPLRATDSVKSVSASTPSAPRSATLRPLQPRPEETEEEPKPSRRFKNVSEGLLAMALSVPPGSPVPPLPIPPNVEAEFAKSLTNDIVLYEDDDERSVELKENIAAAKKQIREMVKQGQSVAEILTEYQNRANEEAALRRQAQFELNKLYRSGAVKEAQAYRDEVNQAFSELGITPVDLPRDRPRTAP